jgi:hypothetical protein
MVTGKIRVKQIVKFEKMIEMFCDSIGIDKKTMLSGLMGNPKQI